MNETELIQNYLTKDTYHLFGILGSTKYYETPRALTASIIDFPQKGWDFFREQKEVLKQKICIEGQICKKITEYEKYEIAAIVALLLPQINTIPELTSVSIILSVIVAKIGIKQFCNC